MRNLFELLIVFSDQKTILKSILTKNTGFSQLFRVQLIKYVIGSKKSIYAPYPRWLGIILARNEEDYNVNHGVVIQILTLSNIISVAPSDGDMQITQKSENWIVNPYTIESPDSKEKDDEDNHGDSDDEEGADVEEGTDDEEDIDVDEDEFSTDKGDASVQGMANYAPRFNQHIFFSSSSTSSKTLAKDFV
ncbi:unnamed protein product [Lactuca saligna]|uniref:Uncharacterized protein n=1 Tax=Lactuca saligna TaxID=75948 RepID=A0AA35YUD0_LACSI|nr:unnamed protein product [Lactuca saligna]